MPGDCSNKIRTSFRAPIREGVLKMIVFRLCSVPVERSPIEGIVLNDHKSGNFESRTQSAVPAPL